MRVLAVLVCVFVLAPVASASERHPTLSELEGEVVCLDRHGKPQFRHPLFRRGEPRFIAFNIL